MRARTHGVARCAVGFLLVILFDGGCRRALSPTEIVVLVRSDLDVDRMKAARLVVRRPDAPEGDLLFGTDCMCLGAAAGCVELPLALGLGPGATAGERRPFNVRSQGYGDLACGAVPIVEQSATVQFSRDHALALEFELLTVCAGVVCGTGTTCVDASRTCVPDTRPDLPALTPGILDGGAAPRRTPACSDGIDNDGDGRIDSADPDCSGPTDDNESPMGCGVIGAPCSLATDCCNGSCIGNSCSAPLCGGPGAPCTSGTTCCNGACSTSGTCICLAGEIQCGTQCVNTNTDSQHCGGCPGTLCTAPAMCVLGACK